MEATYEMNVKELTPEWLEDFKEKFRKEGKFIIRAKTPKPKPHKSQYEVFLEMEEIRKEIEKEPIAFPPGMDINAIIDEVNHVDL